MYFLVWQIICYPEEEERNSCEEVKDLWSGLVCKLVSDVTAFCGELSRRSCWIFYKIIRVESDRMPCL